MPPKAIVIIQYHLDAVSTWLHNQEMWEYPGKHERGIFGVNVSPKILDLHDKLDVPATWFIPGHTIESFPGVCGEIWDRGYDIQHHGWTHTPVAEYESREAEKEDFERGIETIRDFTGRKPEGYGSTFWDFSPHTLDILTELGFEWDSSLMGRDFKAYYVRENWAAPENEPYELGVESDMLEIPPSWMRDDWPPLNFEWGLDNLWVGKERHVFEQWLEQFDYMYDHYDHGIYNLTFHPQVIGTAPRLRYVEELLTEMAERPGVEFMDLPQAVDEIKANEDLWVADSVAMEDT